MPAKRVNEVFFRNFGILKVPVVSPPLISRLSPLGSIASLLFALSSDVIRMSQLRRLSTWLESETHFGRGGRL